MSPTRYDQIVFQHGGLQHGGPAAPRFAPVGSTFRAEAARRLWHDRVSPWLATSPAAPASLFYGVFDTDAVLVRRTHPSGRDGATAHLLIAAKDELTFKSSLELAAWAHASRPARNLLRPDELERLRRPPSGVADQPAALRPTLRVLAAALGLLPATGRDGRHAVVAPPGPHTATILWAVHEILTEVLASLPGTESRSFSYLTFDDRPAPVDPPGLSFRFRPDAPAADLPDGLGPVALRLLECYAMDGLHGLRALLLQERLYEKPTVEERLDLLKGARGRAIPMPPAAAPTAPSPNDRMGHGPPTTPTTSPSPAGGTMTLPSGAAGAAEVSCPVCLGRIPWQGLELLRYDIGSDEIVPVSIPPEAGPDQRIKAAQNAMVRCPNPGGLVEDHYLPASYGSFGEPVVIGFVGGSHSGKTHLLATMIAAIDMGRLSEYKLTAHPLDLVRHERLMREMVRPLLDEGRPIAGTREGIVQFLDGFVVQQNGTSRAVALFDVAGGELTDVEDSKRFLNLADGLVFVVDPDQLDHNQLGDVTFGPVLNLLGKSGRIAKVSAAVVLAKADLLKFDAPIASWLRHEDELLDPDALLRESEEVYAYLHQRGARAWLRPYHDCPKATLHVASALGSESFDRPARPQRVLLPLISLMAMTHLIDTAEARNVGI
jgi:hypothetical protein